VVSPATANSGSAVAYYFAVKVQDEMHLPIVLVVDAVGGTPAEAWTSVAALRPLQDFDIPLAEVQRLAAQGAPEYGNYIMHWYDECDVGLKARGRSERRFGTWQGRWPQELRLAGIRTLEEANRFLRETSIPGMNRKFSVPAAEKGHAFVPVQGQDLDRIFSVQQERVVGKDNTVQWGERVWQIERTPWRGTLAGCRATLCEHLDGRVTIVYGPHVVGRFSATGEPLESSKKARAPRCGNDAPRKAWKTPKAKASFPPFPPRLEIRPRTTTPDSHIPTATTAAGKV
jgi:hypothetical protein